MIERLERYQVVGPYNVGSDESIKIKDIAQKMVTLSGKDIQLEFDPSKKAKIISQQCDCSEAHKELGWKATTSFDEGLKIMYNDVQRRLK
jgi:nucleoside-diphosphate-sugar epimerase